MNEPMQSDVATYRWDDLPHERLNDELSRKVISGAKTMIAQVFFKKGCIVPAHAHVNEQMTYVLRGALSFTIDGQTIVVKEGEVLLIPSNVVHSAEALEDTLEMDIFSPPRQDWLDKTDAYLRGK